MKEFSTRKAWGVGLVVSLLTFVALLYGSDEPWWACLLFSMVLASGLAVVVYQFPRDWNGATQERRDYAKLALKRTIIPLLPILFLPVFVIAAKPLWGWVVFGVDIPLLGACVLAAWAYWRMLTYPKRNPVHPDLEQPKSERIEP